MDEYQVEIRERVTRTEEQISHIKQDVSWIRDKLSNYRPPWSVVVVITALTSVCAVLLKVSLQ